MNVIKVKVIVRHKEEASDKIDSDKYLFIPWSSQTIYLVSLQYLFGLWRPRPRAKGILPASISLGNEL